MSNKDPFDRIDEDRSKLRVIASPSIIPMIRTSIDIEGGPFVMNMYDPPWTFKTYSDAGKGKSAEQHYGCMDLEGIKRLDVREHAHQHAWFWLWATAPMYDAARECFEAWDVTYVTQGVWVKTTKDRKGLAFGTGYVLRNCHEPFLIGRIGKPKICSKSIRSTIMAPRREHSRKPDEAYTAAEQLSGPDVARGDFFSRCWRPGWIAWGNETGKFNQEAA